MKVVILCGGLGTRLREETESKPKPMVEIGGKPILWHIMRTFAHHGYKEFVLCLGYKGEVIKNDVVIAPLRHMPEQDGLAKLVIRRLRECTRTRNRATTIVEPVAF